VLAVDRSEAALALARENLARTGMSGRVELRRSDLLNGLRGPFDLVVSNPPYVLPSDYDSLQPEIRLYEPFEAVVGDRVWERVARGARDALAAGGRLVLECGDGQAGDVAEGLAALGYKGVLCTPDLAGRERVVEGTTPVSDEAVAALRAGQLVVLPTDTVYGLCADARVEHACRRLYAAKRRPETMPVQVLAAGLDAILDAVPEARGRSAVVARALLPGPYTLILPNPARRFRWLTGTRPETIGVRVPALPPQSLEVVRRVGLVASTSANRHGEPDPARREDIHREILDACGAVVDAGGLPGTPSTVLDLTGPEPAVLREGAVTTEQALGAAAAALAAE
jgi:L-threonylcarbamoyladenylate synthase